jgi:glycosyltransferase involved in cell wall biosynthesis
VKSKNIAIMYAGAKYWGGVETYLMQLFEYADNNKIDLTLVSLGEWELCERLRTKGLKVIVVTEYIANPMCLVNIIKILKKGRFDLVTSQGMVANYFARLSSLFAAIPSLVTVHSDYKYDYQGFKKYLYAVSFWLTLPLTKRYITVSNFLKEETKKFGVKENKISVVYNGVNDVGVQLKPLDKKEVAIGSMARLHYKKGYSMLVSAMSGITDLDWTLYIWGEGDERPKLEAMIKKLGLENRIFLPGFTNDVSGSLKSVDIYVQPSLEEGFGITVAEAMYAGKVVVVTPAGSLPELVTDGKTGFVTADISSEALTIELREMIENIDSLVKYGLVAREEALTRFGLDIWIEKITEAYIGTSK